MSVPHSSSYSVREEAANALSHGLGLVLSVIGLVLLLIKSINHQADALTLISMSVYGGSMIALFLPQLFTTLFLLQKQNVGLKRSITVLFIY